MFSGHGRASQNETYCASPYRASHSSDLTRGTRATVASVCSRVSSNSSSGSLRSSGPLRLGFACPITHDRNGRVPNRFTCSLTFATRERTASSRRRRLWCSRLRISDKRGWSPHLSTGDMIACTSQVHGACRRRTVHGQWCGNSTVRASHQPGGGMESFKSVWARPLHCR